MFAAMGCQPEQGLFVCLLGRQLLAERVLEGGAHVPRFQQAASCGAGSGERVWVPFRYWSRSRTCLLLVPTVLRREFLSVGTYAYFSFCFC